MEHKVANLKVLNSYEMRWSPIGLGVTGGGRRWWLGQQGGVCVARERERHMRLRERESERSNSLFFA